MTAVEGECRTARSPSGYGGWEASRRGQLTSLQGLRAGECDSCPVYGTGRIHCEQSQSVNYRRAINRAETDPRVPRSSSPLCLDLAVFRGAEVQRPPLLRPQRACSSTICLADFGTSTFLLVSLRSEQSCAVPIWEKRAAAATFTSPCIPGSMCVTGSLAHLAYCWVRV